ncbi:MAG: cysteine desulfuration protein SufE [Planctomycetes bacterium]|nr:cysteine desulfuration protein SufE [Planctomycetota bacterium]
MTEQAAITIDELTENFEFLGDWEQRFTYLLDLGKKLPPMKPEDCNEDTRVHGCQATVFLKEHVTPASNGSPAIIEFDAQADAFLVSGLIAILRIIYNGRTPQQILDTDITGILTKLDLEEHLSPTRRNGLHAMVKRIRALAAAYQ